jgi:hypothetical protein
MVLFRLPRWVLFVLLAIGIIFVIAGIGMVATGSEGGWPGLLFFALCTAIFAAQLWPGLLLSQPAQSPQALLQRFPGPVELHVPQRKTALILVGMIVFGAVSGWYLYAEPPGGFMAGILWLCIAAIVLGLPFIFYQLVRGASLRLEGDGFRVKQPWRWRFVRWADTSPFDIGSTAIVEQIKGDWSTVVTYDDKEADGSNLGAVNRSIVGRNSALPDTYGLSAEDLQTLMNGWRARALAATPPSRGS